MAAFLVGNSPDLSDWWCWCINLVVTPIQCCQTAINDFGMFTCPFRENTEVGSSWPTATQRNGLALVPLSKAHGTSQAGRPHKLLELDLMGSWLRNRSSKQESKENSDLRTSLGLKVTMTTTSFRLASVDDLCAGFVLRRAWKWPPSDTDSQGPQSLPRSRRRRRCRVRCRP